ncbi:uncharacterized protein CIMG_05638 [Coccidioides immitis RS]|uniref:Membrane anchor Opy2 N-terminal domain-containing protein n=3 Tax=Coccidioides immitis TaxID=5501 RepID=J3KG05_COCIM|nr:uncharacterized protein CIMG_05638 [Coccidioides immitis RS]EAS34614.3 hypothetical protein CIMG_05638 [Coccidioides immitis RS]KMP05787.1 hypothetical protein CIRG_05468 [Coccidioides immitis RMSCC 2394]KMU80828.1 hypothetical protein CISG_08952 [Coccidioides immitis RMSCC 3703]TPX22028.1 hypothetical protein DIZ76_015995 [Coccidioides immitis]
MNPNHEFSRAISWRHPFRRCVVGCPDKPDPCPNCPAGQECVSRPATCDSCMVNVCVEALDSDPSPAPSGPNVGAIAGGVIGGLSILVVLSAIVWYYLKKRKADQYDDWSPEFAEKQAAFAAERRGRMSAVGSIASTVLTRASNVIQIAYIPGVTNRSPPDSPSMVPPVPPIPAVQGNYDQRYFMPGDIRDSVWSSTSEETRRSIAPSLARSSVATTIYRNNAIVSPIPAQQALRAKAAMVSVKSGSSTPVLSSNPSPTTSTPAVPAITVTQINKANAVAAKLEQSEKMPMGSSIVARTAVARPINVTKPKGKKPAEDESKNSPATPIDEDASSPQEKGQPGLVELPSNEKVVRQERRPNVRESVQSTAFTVIDDSPTERRGPFTDSSAVATPSATSSAIPEGISNPSRQSIDSKSTSTHRHRSSQSSNRILDGQAQRSSDSSDQTKRSSPFSDDNEIK